MQIRSSSISVAATVALTLGAPMSAWSQTADDPALRSRRQSAPATESGALRARNSSPQARTPAERRSPTAPAPATATAPGSAPSPSSAQSAGDSPSTTRRSGLRLLGRNTNRGTESAASPTNVTEPAATPVEDAVEFAGPDTPVSLRRGVARTAAAMAATQTVAAVSAPYQSQNDQSPLEQTTGLSPAESADAISATVAALRSSATVSTTELAMAAEKVLHIGRALEIGCATLEPGCRFHAKLVRRNLDSIATQLADSSGDLDAMRLKLALERLDAAADSLRTIGGRARN